MTDPFSITRTDLFAGLDDREAAAVASLGRVRVARAGSVLFRVGEVAESVLLVREGRVDATVPLLVLGEPTQVRLESLGPGDTLGWCALVPPHGFVMTATAATHVVSLAFGREALLRLMAADPRIGLTLVANLASALGRRNVQLQALWVRAMQREVNEARR